MYGCERQLAAHVMTGVKYAADAVCNGTLTRAQRKGLNTVAIDPLPNIEQTTDLLTILVETIGDTLNEKKPSLTDAIIGGILVGIELTIADATMGAALHLACSGNDIAWAANRVDGIRTILTAWRNKSVTDATRAQ